MQDMYEELNIVNMNNGAVIDLLNEEIRKVLNNINDPNAPADAVREIRLSIKVKPIKDGRSATTTVVASSKLPTHKPHESSIGLTFSNNKPKAYVSKMHQMTIDDVISG